MRRLRLWLRSNITDRRVRRVMVAVIGGTVLFIGIAMVVLSQIPARTTDREVV